MSADESTWHWAWMVRKQYDRSEMPSLSTLRNAATSRLHSLLWAWPHLSERDQNSQASARQNRHCVSVPNCTDARVCTSPGLDMAVSLWKRGIEQLSSVTHTHMSYITHTHMSCISHTHRSCILHGRLGMNQEKHREREGPIINAWACISTKQTF